MPGPKQRTSRRGLVAFLGLVVAGGAGAAAWVLRPEGMIDWSKQITSFKYGPNANFTGALYVPNVAAERACPLLLLLNTAKMPEKACKRFAKACETHGWIVASSDAFGNVPSGGDTEAASLFLDAVRTNANVDGGRPVISGFDTAGDAALRLALLQPNMFAGALLECCRTAAWRDLGPMARNDIPFFLFTRTGDSSREGLVTMKDEMERKGFRVTYNEIPGGHESMVRDELDPAFAWLETVRG